MTEALVLFCRVAWLRHYRGLEGVISGAGSERDSRHDWESFNFAPHAGRVYGYVASSGYRTIDVSRLGAHGDTAQGILVVWVSLDPGPHEKGQKIVGWYRNATVHRNLRPSPPRRECRSSSGERVQYHIEATEADMTWLDIESRTFRIRKGRGFMGQSNVCFMESAEASSLVREVTRYIAEYPNARSKATPPPGQSYVEGAVRQTDLSVYERNPAARAACIAHWGDRCAACSVSFLERYGDIGRGFIHVHHVVTVASTSGRYTIDPVRDLIPVCPNCHAMLHRNDPPFTVDDLRERLHQQPPNKAQHPTVRLRRAAPGTAPRG
jgi:hypothetical protein